MRWLLVFSLLGVALASASSGSEQPAFVFSEFFMSLVPYAVLLAVLHILFVSLLFMVGKFFTSDSILGMARHEFSQAIFSAIIVGSVLVGLSVTNNLFCISLPQEYYSGSCDGSDMSMTSHIKVARAHLAESYNNIRVVSKGMLRAYDWSATAASGTVSLGLFSMKPMAFKEIDSFIFMESFSLLYKVLFFVKMQELFLVLNAAYFFPFFFNLGLALRVLPFTRKIGGLLMGITLGLFFVLPFMYVLSQTVIDYNGGFSTRFVIDTSKSSFTFINMFTSVSQSSSQDFEDYMNEAREQGYSNPFGYAVSKNLQEQNKLKYDMASAGLVPDPHDNKAYGDSKAYLNRLDPNSGEDTHEYSIVEIVARIIAGVTVTSVFSLVATIGAIREISKLFGGDVEIAGLTRLI